MSEAQIGLLALLFICLVDVMWLDITGWRTGEAHRYQTWYVVGTLTMLSALQY